MQFKFLTLSSVACAALFSAAALAQSYSPDAAAMGSAPKPAPAATESPAEATSPAPDAVNGAGNEISSAPETAATTAEGAADAAAVAEDAAATAADTAKDAADAAADAADAAKDTADAAEDAADAAKDEAAEATDKAKSEAPATAETAAPEGTANATAANSGGLSSKPLAEIANASEALPSAEVKSMDGTTIGTVKSVKMGDDGMPAKVEVTLADNAKAAKSSKIGLDAKSVSFDENNKVVVAWLTESEIKSLAAAQR